MEHDDALRDYTQDELLLREAGQGWHTEGLMPDILSAVALREYLLDEIVKERVPISEADHPLIKGYNTQVQRVSALKMEHGISDPPPRELSEKPKQ